MPYCFTNVFNFDRSQKHVFSMGGQLQPKTKKVILIVLLIIPILIYILITFMKLNFTKGQKNIERGCDSNGCGHYHASRGTDENGKKRLHKGFDLFFLPNSFVYAPFKMKIKRLGQVYASTPQFTLVEFSGFGVFSVFKIKAMYVDTSLSVGSIIEKGQYFGHVQNIADFHGNGMKNHVHIEVYVMGVRVNPKQFLKL